VHNKHKQRLTNYIYTARATNDKLTKKGDLLFAMVISIVKSLEKTTSINNLTWSYNFATMREMPLISPKTNCITINQHHIMYVCHPTVMSHENSIKDMRHKKQCQHGICTRYSLVRAGFFKFDE